MQRDKISTYLLLEISKHKTYFAENLKKTIKSPSCKNTHSLSTSLKRLIVTKNIILELYGKNIIPHKEMVKVKKFRKSLSSIRDNHELLVKLKELRLNDEFSFSVIEYLTKQQEQLELKIVKHCIKLKNLSIHKFYRKKNISIIIKNPPNISIEDYLQKLISITMSFYDEAIINNNDKALHKMRIKYKDFRYSYELFAPSIINIDNATLDFLKSIQTALGEAHDWLVMKEKICAIKENTDKINTQLLVKTVSRHLKEKNKDAREFIKKEMPKVIELSKLKQQIEVN